MSRPSRIIMENGRQHVMNRGIDGPQLSAADHANQHFLDFLNQMPARLSLRIHAYANSEEAA